MTADRVDWNRVQALFEVRRQRASSRVDFLESYYDWAEDLLADVEHQTETLTGTILATFDNQIEAWLGTEDMEYIRDKVL